MLKAELAFAKSGVLSTRDWDTYQAILRKCLSFKKPLKKSTQKKKSSSSFRFRLNCFIVGAELSVSTNFISGLDFSNPRFTILLH